MPIALSTTLRSQSVPGTVIGRLSLEPSPEITARLEATALAGVPVRFRIARDVVDAHGLASDSTLAIVDPHGEPLSLIEAHPDARGLSCIASLPVLGGSAPRSFDVAIGTFARIARCGPATDAIPGGITVDGRLRLRSERGYDRDRREETWKAHDAVFGVDGEMLTKGAGGKFPHHRGIFAGWNKMTCGGKAYDFWHGRAGETIEVVEDTETPKPSCVASRRVTELAWKAADG
ncbi:MAG: PmoA family protein, partial [Planctomycetes bacterium]|nr:PmoA family protein [Planctomycetota bacterium]